MEPGNFKSFLRHTVLLPIVLLAVLAGALAWQVAYMTSAMELVQHTDNIAGVARQLMRSIVDMETGLRGYLLTNDTGFLQPYKTAEPQVEERFAELERTIDVDSEERDALRLVETDYRSWHIYSKQMIEWREQGKDTSGAAMNLEEKRLMDGVRLSRERLLDKVEALRDLRAKRARHATRATLAMVALLTLGVAFVLALVTKRRLVEISQVYQQHLQTEQERAEEARENREWLLTTLRSMGEGVVATDADGKVKFMNPTAERITGWTQAEAENQPVSDVLQLSDPKKRTALPDPIERVKNAGAGVERLSERLLSRRDGTVAYVDESAASIPDATGTMRGMVLVLRDVTERKRSEAALQSSERLALIGRLAATIAHEIRNPLDAVMNLTYLVKSSPALGNDVRGHVMMAEDELRRIVHITSQLLSFHREAREAVSVDVEEIMESVLALFAPKLASSRIEVKREYKSHPAVMAFPGELRQVFSNLLANAMDAVGKNGVIRVRVAPAQGYGNGSIPGVRILVADNGCGIPDTSRESLFTPFFTTKGERGTGLGLWVSRGIVEKHEGTLRLRSSQRPGRYRGTAFAIFLPQQPQNGSRAAK